MNEAVVVVQYLDGIGDVASDIKGQQLNNSNLVLLLLIEIDFVKIR